MSVLMWVIVSSESSMVVSTGSSMSIELYLLDNGIGSFISVFYLVWIFPFLCLGFSLILVVYLTFVWNC